MQRPLVASLTAKCGRHDGEPLGNPEAVPVSHDILMGWQVAVRVDRWMKDQPAK